jgi:hypothetical protein
VHKRLAGFVARLVESLGTPFDRAFASAHPPHVFQVPVGCKPMVFNVARKAASLT